MLTLLLVATFAWLRVQGAAIPPSPIFAHPGMLSLQPRIECPCGDIRPLLDIIRGCLFTIAACVYRAIHQNIPDPSLPYSGRLRIRIRIAIYALIAPEFMIWWAMRQLFGAKRIVKEVNDLGLGLNWTHTHGHFAQMGGFGRKDNKRVLYPPTLIELLKDGRLDIEELKLTKEDINDKSKGDFLSKALVAIQTTWFVLESLARLHQGLPLLELEVFTLAFATLNTLTYAFWWYKPLDVLRPVYLHVQPEVPTGPDAAANSRSDSSQDINQPDIEQQPSIPPDNPETNAAPAGGEAVGQLSPPQVDSSLGSTPDLNASHGLSERLKMARGSLVAAIKKDIKDEGWWWTLWTWVVKPTFVAVAGQLQELLVDEEVHEEATHVSTFYGMTPPEESWRMIEYLSCFVGMAFGAIHFLSWDSDFPTHTELVLWRVSSSVLLVQPILILLKNICGQIWVEMLEGSWLESRVRRLERIFFYAALYGGPIPYILARFCLLVLALLTLHDLPPGATTNVSWTSYIPHF